jgi:hypothetical protein
MLDHALEVECFDQRPGKMLELPQQATELANRIVIVTFDDVEAGRKTRVFGQERPDLGRPNDVGYPARGALLFGGRRTHGWTARAPSPMTIRTPPPIVISTTAGFVTVDQAARIRNLPCGSARGRLRLPAVHPRR